MKYHKVCDCCGHKTTAYTINMSETMMDAFCRFMRMVTLMAMEHGSFPGQPKGRLGLTNSQYSNRQNLAYFGIIEQSNGLRFPTELGWDRYLGRKTIKTPAGMMAGKTLPDDHEAWETHTEKRRSIYILEKDQIDVQQDNRDKYKEEASIFNRQV